MRQYKAIIPERRERIDVSTTPALAYRLKEFPGCNAGRGSPGGKQKSP